MQWLQKLAEFSLKSVYLPGLKNSVEDAVSREPAEAGYPDEGDIGDSSSGPCAPQDPVVFTAV